MLGCLAEGAQWTLVGTRQARARLQAGRVLLRGPDRHCPQGMRPGDQGQPKGFPRMRASYDSYLIAPEGSSFEGCTCIRLFSVWSGQGNVFSWGQAQKKNKTTERTST